ncbi:MAG: histidine kinase [Hymenobacter sp.]|nr:histidine kinase [Hymenobacter sp.]
MIPIYSQKTRIKILVAVLALLIGAATVIYTNLLVQRVSEREQQQIQLYAKALEYIINSETETNTFVFNEIISNNTTIPVILSSDGKDITNAKNITMPAHLSPADSVTLLESELLLMKKQHPPIIVKFGAGQVNYIFYRDSQLLRQLRTYPLVQLVVIGCLAVIAYFAFSSSRRAEQNRVWVGLAKETAHQLGTPLSSLVGWQNYLRDSERFRDEPIVEELGKDIRRLEIITERFSNIG